MVATAAAPYAALFLAGCGLLGYVGDRITAGGVAVLAHGLLLALTVVFGLLVAGAISGAVSIRRQLSATQRLGEHVDRNRIAPPPGTPAGVEVVDDDEPFAFTFGLSTPRVR